MELTHKLYKEAETKPRTTLINDLKILGYDLPDWNQLTDRKLIQIWINCQIFGCGQ